MTAPRLRLCEAHLLERDVRFRTPFRFGSATTTRSPQLFARVRITLEDGRSGWGTSSQLLGAKWFDKNPALTAEQNYSDLRSAVSMTIAAYLGETSLQTAFGLHAAHYGSLLDDARRIAMKPLVLGYGPAVIDMAILDALFRLLSVDAFEAMTRNLAGIAPALLSSEFFECDFAAFLHKLQLRTTIGVRHTIGLADAIDGTDLPSGSRIGDGLPETLGEVLIAEAPSYFKIKLGGNEDVDVDRLLRIARLLDAAARPYRVTFDGNEQFTSAGRFRQFWNRCAAEPRLASLMAQTLFIEQPLSREHAFTENVSGIANGLPIIIDESDDHLDAFAQAAAMGYRGVSSKSCKGVYKSLINRERCERWNHEQPRRPFLMSAEDLTTQPGVSLQQDLVLAGLLGMRHVERNAHHYVDGMSPAPSAEQIRFAMRHEDLYVRSGDVTRLRIDNGVLRFASLRCHGFGLDCEPDWDSMTPSEACGKSACDGWIKEIA